MLASITVSALALTCRFFIESAHFKIVSNSGENWGSIRLTVPTIILPVEPSKVITSPWWIFCPLLVMKYFSFSFTVRPFTPQTQGLPIPRATTAAWEVIPPRAVIMPLATCIPLISSGLVSFLTRITLWWWASSSAS